MKKDNWRIERALDGTKIYYKNGQPYKYVMPNGLTQYIK